MGEHVALTGAPWISVMPCSAPGWQIRFDTVADRPLPRSMQRISASALRVITSIPCVLPGMQCVA
jgi:hypothetical protein